MYDKFLVCLNKDIMSMSKNGNGSAIAEQLEKGCAGACAGAGHGVGGNDAAMVGGCAGSCAGAGHGVGGNDAAMV